MPRKNAEGTVGILMVLGLAFITFASIIFPVNLWMQIWTVILSLPVDYLAYLFILIGVLGAIGFFMFTGQIMKLNAAFVALWCTVAGLLLLLDPMWFYTWWL
jgi:hypothetical protein